MLLLLLILVLSNQKLSPTLDPRAVAVALCVSFAKFHTAVVQIGSSANEFALATTIDRHACAYQELLELLRNCCDFLPVLQICTALWVTVTLPERAFRLLAFLDRLTTKGPERPAHHREKRLCKNMASIRTVGWILCGLSRARHRKQPTRRAEDG